MEQTVIFEEKVYLSPKDMNRVAKDGIDKILLRQLSKKLEGKCSQHGFVIPNSLEILSRSMGALESGRYTGNIVFYIQAQGRVYNPVNGTRITGKILKRNKMGLYVIYEDAIRVLVPRDLHLNDLETMQIIESLDVGTTIEVEIRKSRFQIHDPFILSVGVFIRQVDGTVPVLEETSNVQEEEESKETEEESENDVNDENKEGDNEDISDLMNDLSLLAEEQVVA